VVFAIKSLAGGENLATAAGLLALGVGSGWVFVRRQLGRPRPLVDLRLLRSPVVSSAITANLLSIGIFTGLLLLASQYLQLVLGRSPMDAGLLLVPGLAAAVLAGLAAVPLARRLPVRWLVTVGLLLGAAGCAVATGFDADSGLAPVVLSFLLVACGAGLSETLTNDAILSAAPAHQAGQASAVSETAYELGTGLGVAVLGSVLAFVYSANLALPTSLAADERETAGTLGGALNVADRLPPEEAEAVASSAQAAFTSGLGVAAVVGVVMMLAAALVVAARWREA
jgi:DHA2 family multidrug resistance protein-like MFS transporter